MSSMKKILVVGGYRSYATKEAELFAGPRGYDHFDIDTRRPINTLISDLQLYVDEISPDIIVAQSTGALIASQVFTSAELVLISPFRYFKRHELMVLLSRALWLFGVRSEGVAFVRAIGAFSPRRPKIKARLMLRPTNDKVIAGDRSCKWHRESMVHALVSSPHNILMHGQEFIDWFYPVK